MGITDLKKNDYSILTRQFCAQCREKKGIPSYLALRCSSQTRWAVWRAGHQQTVKLGLGEREQGRKRGKEMVGGGVGGMTSQGEGQRIADVLPASQKLHNILGSVTMTVSIQTMQYV